MDKPKKQKKKIIEIPQYNDPMNKEGVIPTDVLGSYSGTPLDGSQPVQRPRYPLSPCPTTR